MDTRNEIRQFLTSRRARITPERAGLRREEVALLAGVSVDYYTRLERGNASGVSETVLEALARALQLDDTERTHLVDLARELRWSPDRRAMLAANGLRLATPTAAQDAAEAILARLTVRA